MDERRKDIREIVLWTQYSRWGQVQDPGFVPYLQDPYDPDPYQ